MTRKCVLLGALLTLGAACSAGEEASVASSESEQTTCPADEHECPAWGATCNGATLETCVVDERGCRKKLSTTCALGCEVGACTTCDAVPTRPAVKGSSVTSPTSLHRAVAIHGDVAFTFAIERNGIYQGKTSGIVAVSLASPDAPATLARTALPDGTGVRDLRVSGARLFALTLTSLLAWDIGQAGALAARSTYTPASAPTALVIEGDRAYVGTASSVEVVDLAASPPALLATIPTGTRAQALAVSGGRVAVASGSTVSVFRLDTNGAPEVVATTTVPVTIYGDEGGRLAFDGARLWISGTTSSGGSMGSAVHGLELGTGKDGKPALLLRGGLRGVFARNLVLQGDELTVADGPVLGTLDVSNPAAPAWKKHVWIGKESQGLARRGDHVYVGDDTGVTAVALGAARDVVLQKKAQPDPILGAAHVGAVGYLARPVSGLVIEDQRVPAKPVQLSATAMLATGVVVANRTAYVTTPSELRIYDVRSPWKPELLGTAPVSLGQNDPGLSQPSLDGTRLFTSCGSGDVCVFDVTLKKNPALLTVRQPILEMHGIQWAGFASVMVGPYLYAASNERLMVADLSNPNATVKVADIPIEKGYQYRDVRMGADAKHAVVVHACGGTDDRCVTVFDVTSPGAPVKVGAAQYKVEIGAGTYQVMNASDKLASVRVAGKQAFVSNMWGGITVIDLADPTKPVSRGDLWTSMPARRSFVRDRFLTTYTQASWPLAEPGDADQILELCKW